MAAVSEGLALGKRLGLVGADLAGDSSAGGKQMDSLLGPTAAPQELACTAVAASWRLASQLAPGCRARQLQE